MSESFNSNISSGKSYSSIFNETQSINKILLFIIVFLVFSIVCVSCMSCMSVFTPTCSANDIYDYFTNSMEDEKTTYVNIKEQKIIPNKFQLIPLTGLNTLQFGQLQRTITNINGKVKTLFDITANLYILDGNIFQEKEKDHVYKLFVTNNLDDKILVGKLSKDGDGLYKLKKEINDDLSLYKNVFVVYTKNNIDNNILYGTF